MKDLVVGAITDYDFDRIRPWLDSLDASGFSGDVALIAYNASYSTVDALRWRGCLVVTFDRYDTERRFGFADSAGEQILVSRFFHLWCLLSDPIAAGYRYVLHSDVKDVIVQTNPSEWLTAHLGEKLLNVGSESVRFADEPWGWGVMQEAFEPAIQAHMAERTIYNAGTIAGVSWMLRDFALQVYLAARHAPEHPDQACANVLLALEPYRSITRFNASEDGWACQLGTTVAPSYITNRRVPLLEPEPTFDGSTVRTRSGKPFCLVHQYDRIPAWRDALLRKYASEPRRSTRPVGTLVERPEWRLTRPEERARAGAR